MPTHETSKTPSLTTHADPTPSHTLSYSHASSTPLPPSTNKPAISSSSSPVQSEPVEDLVTLSQEFFASLKTPNAPFPTEDELTPAQQQRIENKRQEAIRRNEHLKR